MTNAWYAQTRQSNECSFWSVASAAARASAGRASIVVCADDSAVIITHAVPLSSWSPSIRVSMEVLLSALLVSKISYQRGGGGVANVRHHGRLVPVFEVSASPVDQAKLHVRAARRRSHFVACFGCVRLLLRPRDFRTLTKKNQSTQEPVIVRGRALSIFSVLLLTGGNWLKPRRFSRRRSKPFSSSDCSRPLSPRKAILEFGVFVFVSSLFYLAWSLSVLSLAQSYGTHVYQTRG